MDKKKALTGGLALVLLFFFVEILNLEGTIISQGLQDIERLQRNAK